eukprot:6172467-Pleurochrysis_carterae.AAC.1
MGTIYGAYGLWATSLVDSSYTVTASLHLTPQTLPWNDANDRFIARQRTTRLEGYSKDNARSIQE